LRNPPLDPFGAAVANPTAPPTREAVHSATSPRKRRARSRPARALLAGVGMVCVALGGIGMVVPGMPATIFLIAASFLFARSSPVLRRRLRRHPRLGDYVRMAESGSMPRRAKWMALSGMWVGAAASAPFVVRAGLPVLVGVLALVAVGSWAVLVRVRTATVPQRVPR